MSEKNHPEDNISFRSIKKFIHGTFELLFEFLGFLKLVFLNHKFSLLLGLLISLLAGYAYFLTIPKFYTASMIVQQNNLSKKTYAEILEQLDQLTRNGSDKSLAAQLNIQEKLASKILFIEGRNIDNKLLSSDTTTKLKQPFKIILGLAAPIDPVDYQASIVSYLNNGPYLKKFREEQRKINLEKLDFITAELLKIDSLKREYNKFLANSRSSSTIYSDAFNPADIYVHSFNLIHQKEAILLWLNIDENAISVLDGFKLIDSPSSISLFKSLMFFGLAGFSIIFGISFAKELQKKISKKEEKAPLKSHKDIPATI